MVTELDSLRTSEDLVDVTLSCDGQLFKAHKVVLSMCSSYFRNVFKVRHIQFLFLYTYFDAIIMNMNISEHIVFILTVLIG